MFTICPYIFGKVMLNIRKYARITEINRTEFKWRGTYFICSANVCSKSKVITYDGFGIQSKID